MSKRSTSLDALPEGVFKNLEALGQRLRAHRIARGWTVAEAAERLLCSPTTLRALEAGRPGTSLGLLAHALWLLGEIDTLERVAPAPTVFTARKRVRRRADQPARGVIHDAERDF